MSTQILLAQNVIDARNSLILLRQKRYLQMLIC
jgi:hypothetical protein